MFMNESDIDDAIRILSDAGSPIAPYAEYLGEWRDIINDNSDGWVYWRVGHNAANKLCEQVEAALNYHRGWANREGEPSVEAVRRTLAPIKAAATRHGLPQPSEVGVS